MKSRRWQLAGLAIAIAVVCAGKHYYRDASPADLRWILAPTACAVSVVTGGSFTYEAGAGWIDRDQAFVIAPACAGLNFALAAFLALAIGWAGAMASARATAGRLAAAAALAYAATLVVNTVRIAIAIALHDGTISTLGLGSGDAHRAEGIAVYLGGLCALYALARGRTAKPSTTSRGEVQGQGTMRAQRKGDRAAA